MARNPNSRETAAPNAAAGANHNNDRQNGDVARENVNDYAGTRPLLDLDTFNRVVNDWKQLADCARLQLETLADLNCTLRKEIARLAEKEARARHLAYHDALTGLPNRSLLQDRFQQARSQAMRHHKPLALLLLDLDQFKQVNDELGHASGDKLLQEVALRMTNAIRAADTASRYGGDEFVIMLPFVDNQGTATVLAAEIARRLCAPYMIDGHIIQMSVSIGVALYPGDGQTFDNLLKQADIAMYRAKRNGQRIFNSEQHPETPGEAEWHKPLEAGKTERPRKRDASVQGDIVNLRQPPKKH